MHRHYFFAVVKKHVAHICRQRLRAYHRFALPEFFPCFRIVRFHVARFFVPRKILAHPRLVAGVVEGQKSVELPLLVAHQREHMVPGHDDLLSTLASRQVMQLLAGRGVQHADRFIDTQRYVYAIAHRHQSPRQLCRTALQGPQVAVPFAHRLFPQHHAVERVARHQSPARGQLDGHPRTLVHDIKHAAIGGDQRAHAGHAVVMSRPTWAPLPLQVPRWAHLRVVRHCVAALVMQKMGPVINVVRAGFHRLLPVTALLHVRHALGRQHPHHLGHRHALQIFRHQEIHGVINVRQPAARQSIGRHGPIQARLADGRACPSHILPQAMHKIPFIHAQCGG